MGMEGLNFNEPVEEKKKIVEVSPFDSQSENGKANVQKPKKTGVFSSLGTALKKTLVLGGMMGALGAEAKDISSAKENFQKLSVDDVNTVKTNTVKADTGEVFKYDQKTWPTYGTKGKAEVGKSLNKVGEPSPLENPAGKAKKVRPTLGAPSYGDGRPSVDRGNAPTEQINRAPSYGYGNSGDNGNSRISGRAPGFRR